MIIKKMCVLAAVALAASAGEAKIELGAPFADGMVLQRGMPVPVWGTATPEKLVTVRFADAEVSAIADSSGTWRVTLPKLAASKTGRVLEVVEDEPQFNPFSLFGAASDRVALEDVLVGEVWFACGQSNMECPIWHAGNSRYRDGKGAMMTQMTRLENVRFVKTPRAYGAPGRAKLRAVWKKMVPENFATVPDDDHWKLLSGVAWYFARELYLALDIPIGIVESSIGGTNIDAWTPRSGYENCSRELRATADYELHFGKDWDPKKHAVGPINGALQQPTVLFNSMVWDYAPMAMRGLIWYQGCHNAGDGEAERYCAKMHALYNGWAKEFENKNLKLYFAQLAPYKTNWMKLVASQNRFADEEPNAAIAVTADVGNFDDIHPNDKETVAQRLVFQALKRDYGFAIPETDSPVCRGATFADGVVTLKFDYVKTWYVYNRNMSRDVPFEVAGTDGVWKSAKLVDCGDRFEPWQTFCFIDRPVLKVKSDAVPNPVAVRYLGKNLTSGVLYNQASLPLGPFTIAK